MLKLMIIGKITNDAEIKTFSGKKVLKFTVNHSYKDKDGKYHNVYVGCSYWTEKADSLVKFMTKGKNVYCEGDPTVSTYQKEGTTLPALNLAVNRVEFISEAVGGNSKIPSETKADISASPTEDMPF